MKILAFTSIRSDYDLMYPLYKLLHEDINIDFRIMISGAHLSHAFGYSVEQIRKDGFNILLEIETLFNSDTGLSRVKSASVLLQNSLETIAKFSPDLMIYAGDREDVLMYAMIGGYLNIPTIHFFAGDHVIDGYIDNPIRHATAKLSTAQFVALEEHKQRLIKMGENHKRVFVIGNISLDKFINFKSKSKEELYDFFQCKNKLNDYALMIFHPTTKELNSIEILFENILLNLKKKNIFTFVSYPNVDPGNQKMMRVIEKYSSNENFIFYKNLNREIFMSLYKNAKFIIGNSSSGIYEAASLKIPAINVGMRQTGRFADENVIFCKSDSKSIENAIEMALSSEFQNILKGVKNSYGDGNSAKKAYELIKSTDFKSMIEKVEDPLKVEL